MKYLEILLILLFSLNTFARGSFDCRGEYEKFIKTTRSWGSDEEYQFFMDNQTKQGKRLLAQNRFNKSQWLRWRKSLFEKAYALIKEAYSRGSTPLVNRISTKGKVPKKYIFNYLKKGNRSKKFCDGKPIDYNTLALSIWLSYKEKE
jgi:hypothetical protein